MVFSGSKLHHPPDQRLDGVFSTPRCHGQKIHLRKVVGKTWIRWFLPCNTLRLFQHTNWNTPLIKPLPTRPSFGIPFIVVERGIVWGVRYRCVVSFLENTGKMVQTQASLPSWDGAKTLGDHGINYLIVFFFGGEWT